MPLDVIRVERVEDIDRFLDTIADPREYFFFLHDLTVEMNYSKALIATDGRMRGCMLIYRQRNVQVRGDREGCLALLDTLDLRDFEVTVPLFMMEEIRNTYLPEKDGVMLRMVCDTQITMLPDPAIERPSNADAEEVTALLNKAFKDQWYSFRENEIKEKLKRDEWSCIRKEGRIIAVGGTLIDDFAGLITIIATCEGHRGEGSATRIVRHLTDLILSKAPLAIIHVMDDNAIAKNVYEKAGFKEHRRFYFFQSE